MMLDCPPRKRGSRVGGCVGPSTGADGKVIMSEKTCTRESFKAESGSFVEKLRRIVREGNVRRVVLEHDGRTIAEFPLTAGVVGAVLAPVAAAIGALVALLQDCTIHVERASAESVDDTSPEATRPGSARVA
jgi:hypothetical protein